MVTREMNPPSKPNLIRTLFKNDHLLYQKSFHNHLENDNLTIGILSISCFNSWVNPTFYMMSLPLTETPYSREMISCKKVVSLRVMIIENTLNMILHKLIGMISSSLPGSLFLGIMKMKSHHLLRKHSSLGKASNETISQQCW